MGLEPNLEYRLGIINMNGNSNRLSQLMRDGNKTRPGQHMSHTNDSMPAPFLSMCRLEDFSMYSKYSIGYI